MVTSIRTFRSRSLRRAGLTLLPVVLLVGCAGSPSGPTLAQNNPSRRVPPSPVTKIVLSRTEQAVVARARAYFQADGDRNYKRMANLSVGTIRSLWSWYDSEFGSCTCPKEDLEIDRINVSQIHGDRATVDLRTTLVASDHTTVFTGPMKLVRRNGAWFVADYRRNGIPFAQTVSPRSATASASGLTVSLLGMERDLSGEVAWLRITNYHGTNVGVASWTATLGSTPLTPAIYRPDIGNISPGYWMTRDFEWAGTRTMIAGRPLRIRLVFQDLRTGSRISLTLSTLS